MRLRWSYKHVMRSRTQQRLIPFLFTATMLQTIDDEALWHGCLLRVHDQLVEIERFSGLAYNRMIPCGRAAVDLELAFLRDKGLAGRYAGDDHHPVVSRHARRVRPCALGAAGVIVRLAAGGGKVYAGPVPEVKQGPIGARPRLAEQKPGGQDAAEIACRLAAR